MKNRKRKRARKENRMWCNGKGRRSVWACTRGIYSVSEYTQWYTLHSTMLFGYTIEDCIWFQMQLYISVYTSYTFLFYKQWLSPWTKKKIWREKESGESLNMTVSSAIFFLSKSKKKINLLRIKVFFSFFSSIFYKYRTEVERQERKYTI